MLNTLERVLIIVLIVIMTGLYDHQVDENMRLNGEIQRLSIKVNQLQSDLKHYTDPDVIQDRTIKRLLGQKEDAP